MSRRFREDVQVAPEIETIVHNTLTGNSKGVNVKAKDNEGAFILGWPKELLARGYISFEPVHAVVEGALPPRTSATETRKDIDLFYQRLHDVLAPHGLRPGLPSILGPDEEFEFYDDVERYILFEHLLKEGWITQGEQVSTHINVSMSHTDSDRARNQFNLGIAASPVLHALCASTPLYKGTLFGESHRTWLMEEEVYKRYPQGAEIPAYVTDLNEYYESVREMTKHKIEKMRKGAREAGVSEDIINTIDFENEIQKTGGVVRVRGEGESFRFEDRGPDHTKKDIVVGVSALTLGLQRHNIPVYAGAGERFYDGTAFRTPDMNTIRYLNKSNGFNGIRLLPLQVYARAMLKAARNGLSKEEAHDLEIIEEIIETGRTLSYQIKQDVTNISEKGRVMQEHIPELANNIAGYIGAKPVKKEELAHVA